MAASTVMEDYKSKRACPFCGQKKLWTNDSAKVDDGMFHVCLSCGYEFFDNDQLREYRDSEKKEENKSPWNEGFLVLLAMLVVILTLRVGRQQDGFVETVGPQVERSQGAIAIQ